MSIEFGMLVTYYNAVMLCLLVECICLLLWCVYFVDQLKFCIVSINGSGYVCESVFPICAYGRVVWYLRCMCRFFLLYCDDDWLLLCARCLLS